jgi:hypothetical protein
VLLTEKQSIIFSSFLFNNSGTICSLMIWYQIQGTAQHSFGILSTNHILTHKVMKYRPQQVYIRYTVRPLSIRTAFF